MKRNFRYGKILTAFLCLFLSSCKNKTAEHEGHQQTNSHNEVSDKSVSHDTMNMGDTNMFDHSSMNHSDMSISATTRHQNTVNTNELQVNDLLMPSNQSVVSQLTTIKLLRKTLTPQITATGILDYDQRRFLNVAARVNGRIEKLFVKYSLQKVNKGQKLFEIYSPELVNAQNDFVFLLNEGDANSTSLQSAEKKLRLLGLSGEQIQSLSSLKKPSLTFPVSSPQNGYVVFEKDNTPMSVTGNPSQSGMSGMENNLPTTTVVAKSSSEIVREGDYVTKGQTVFRIVNTDELWALLKIFREDAVNIKVGDKADLTVENFTDKIHAQVDFIQQFYNADDNTSTVRIYLKNYAHAFRVGNLVTAEIRSKEIAALWIPLSSILDLGNKQVVFLKKGNLFQTSLIKTGRKVQDMIEVLGGLREEDEIAFNAQYMIDSEAFIKTK